MGKASLLHLLMPKEDPKELFHLHLRQLISKQVLVLSLHHHPQTWKKFSQMLPHHLQEVMQ